MPLSRVLGGARFTPDVARASLGLRRPHRAAHRDARPPGRRDAVAAGTPPGRDRRRRPRQPRPPPARAAQRGACSRSITRVASATSASAPRACSMVAADLRYVPADLEEFGMSQRLAAAGHDRRRADLLRARGARARTCASRSSSARCTSSPTPRRAGSRIAISLRHARHAALCGTSADRCCCRCARSASRCRRRCRPTASPDCSRTRASRVQHDSDTQDWAEQLCPAQARREP